MKQGVWPNLDTTEIMSEYQTTLINSSGGSRISHMGAQTSQVPPPLWEILYPPLVRVLCMHRIHSNFMILSFCLTNFTKLSGIGGWRPLLTVCMWEINNRFLAGKRGPRPLALNVNKSITFARIHIHYALHYNCLVFNLLMCVSPEHMTIISKTYISYFVCSVQLNKRWLHTKKTSQQLKVFLNGYNYSRTWLIREFLTMLQYG